MQISCLLWDTINLAATSVAASGEATFGIQPLTYRCWRALLALSALMLSEGHRNIDAAAVHS